MTLKELIDKRIKLARDIEKLAKRFKAAGDKWEDDATREEWERVSEEYDATVEQIDVEQRAEAVDREQRQPLRSFAPGERPGLEDRDPWRGVGQATGQRFVDVRTGRESRILDGRDSMAAAMTEMRGDESEDDQIDLGQLAAGWATGEWRGRERERRFLSGVSTGGGAITLPVGLSSQIIDLARNKSSVFRAGYRTVPMETGEMWIPRLTGDATAQWKGWGQAMTDSEPTFEGIRLQARTLMAIVGAPIELVEDSPMIGEAVRNSIAEAIALEFDRQALRGDGDGSPIIGIRNTTDVQTTAIGGNVGYDDLIRPIARIEEENGEPNAMILSARTMGALRLLKDGEGRYLRDHPDVKALTRLVSNQIPTDLGVGENETEVYVGDFTQALVGIRTNLRFEVFNVGTVDGKSAVDRGLIWFRAYLRGDIHLAHPKHFNVLTGVTN